MPCSGYCGTLLNFQELGDDCHPSERSELSHHGVEGLHLTISSPLWYLCCGRSTHLFVLGNLRSGSLRVGFLLNNFECRGLAAPSGVAGLNVGRQQLDVTTILVRTLGLCLSCWGENESLQGPVGPSLVLSTSSHVCQGTVIWKTGLCWPDMLVPRRVIMCRTCQEMKPGGPKIGQSVDRECGPVFLGVWLWQVGATLPSSCCRYNVSRIRSLCPLAARAWPVIGYHGSQ